MNFNFIYTKEYLRPLRAVLVDVRYSSSYPTVNNDDLFYCIEDSNGSLAGVLILTVNNEFLSCIEKFNSVRVPFKDFEQEINNDINAFIQSGNWKNNFIFYTSKINQRIPIAQGMDILYGFNGVMAFSARPFSNQNVLNSIATIGKFNIMRYPGGNAANSFNWHTGQDDDNTGQPNTLADLKALYDDRGCDILFVLNMLTHTRADQLDMLIAADVLGIPIKYVELGNEFNNINNPGHIVFPTPEDYFAEAAIWRDAIKAIYPNCKVSVIGGNRTWPGGENWNDVGLTINPDAFTWHVSPSISTFWNGSTINYVGIDADINDDWTDGGFDLVTTVPIWATEFNYTFDDNNLLPENIAKDVTLYMLQKIPLYIGLNDGIKIMCVRNIEGDKQGAFDIRTSIITIRATGIAMQEFIASLNI